ncbi:hypothetical protein BRAS3843_2520013 [Bradyrhizobium sp. STM 3843]|nr:hypothetical protein BRAS3843_2520013 [Bradyrhizobium sp. STM 3843]
MGKTSGSASAACKPSACYNGAMTNRILLHGVPNTPAIWGPKEANWRCPIACWPAVN